MYTGAGHQAFLQGRNPQLHGPPQQAHPAGGMPHMATLGGPPGAHFQGGYAANGPQARYAYPVAGPGFPPPYPPVPQVIPNVPFDQRTFHNPFPAPQPPQVPMFGGGPGAGPAVYGGGGAGGGQGFLQAQNPLLAQHNGNPYATAPQFQQPSGPPFAGASGALVVGTSTRQHVTDVNGNLRGTNTSNAQVKVNKAASLIRLCGDNESLLGYIKDGVSCKTDAAVNSFWAAAARSQNANQVGGLAVPAMRNYQVFLDPKLTESCIWIRYKRQAVVRPTYQRAERVQVRAKSRRSMRLERRDRRRQAVTRDARGRQTDCGNKRGCYPQAKRLHEQQVRRGHPRGREEA